MAMTLKQLALLQEPISALGLGVRLINSLEEANIFTVADLLKSCGKGEPGSCQHCDRRHNCQAVVHLPDVRNVGEKSLQELYDALEAHGFYRDSRKGAAEQAARNQAKPKFRGRRW
jgi:hypothetical protein